MQNDLNTNCLNLYLVVKRPRLILIFFSETSPGNLILLGEKK